MVSCGRIAALIRAAAPAGVAWEGKDTGLIVVKAKLQVFE